VAGIRRPEGDANRVATMNDQEATLNSRQPTPACRQAGSHAFQRRPFQHRLSDTDVSASGPTWCPFMLVVVRALNPGGGRTGLVGGMRRKAIGSGCDYWSQSIRRICPASVAPPYRRYGLQSRGFQHDLKGNLSNFSHRGAGAK
jgi:hypothetical protein